MTPNQDTTLSAVAFARARRGRAAELGDLLVRLAERSRTEEGCLECRVHRDLADPDLFVCYERWASEEAVARHLAQPHVKQFMDRRMEYLQRDLDVHRLGPAGPATEPEAPGAPARPAPPPARSQT
ncbi:putative quinol monooxygenase [Streptomyces sp. Go-475]|uniref:putative quinol monooxygenase n=1 Tax=Streptomyces sp. Go-475 TaxID=2072505 RepID=UPI000DF04D8D|nr:putative quinol monooxygenase [Streptomyces sp. Go-475]AXE89713.1 Antibiotic biosynthesis monooxygenase [Streptomyces sp. Go-475]